MVMPSTDTRLCRVEAMVNGAQWDLSKVDRAAIQAVLADRDELVQQIEDFKAACQRLLAQPSTGARRETSKRKAPALPAKQSAKRKPGGFIVQPSDADDCVAKAKRDHASAAIEQCHHILELLDQMSSTAWESDFPNSVQEKVESILAWAEEKGHVTGAQQSALENMEHGVKAWLP